LQEKTGHEKSKSKLCFSEVRLALTHRNQHGFEFNVNLRLSSGGLE